MRIARTAADTPDGEYRSHLLFQIEPSGNEPVDLNVGENNPSGLDIRLHPVFGISIPVVIRIGELAATANITDLHLHTDGDRPQATFTLQRQGDRSLFGDIAVYFQPEDGHEERVGLRRGLAVYPPLEARQITIPLNIPPDSRPSGRLRVEYNAQEGRHARLAETELQW
ncbi:hypothetical protein [Alkalilimnicola ehrlichii]|uniref:Pili assembly chaperone N-terminal domain-containing protein n=1 Tax=Alkalilimnicola ehrlichii TaxID=351052 RepID=A0A3E0WU11_9GAMM|nr:hypothetical protein [Alkalilimnicola ehrlichii]RFA36482.1 hypothetical protein CAL65_10920 [Alkalilimnicola ehrlichii]